MQGVREWIASHPTLTVAGALVIISVTVAVSTSAPVSPSEVYESGESGGTARAASTTTISATDASAEFTHLMETAENAALVSSYEFSDSARVIYVTDVWYSMTVQFKKGPPRQGRNAPGRDEREASL